MDITIEEYVHPVHWPFCWPLFKGYVEEVCGWNHLDRLKNVSMDDGRTQVSTGLEQWIVGLPQDIKVVRDKVTDQYIGFIAYTYPYKKEPGNIWVECLYITPNLRYNGVTRALLSSFLGVTHGTFALHKSRRKSPDNPPPLIAGLLNGHLIGDDPRNPHLELWTFRVSHHQKGENPKMAKYYDIAQKRKVKV